MTARIVLLLLASLAAQDAFGGFADCKRRLLTAEEYATLETAVLKATGIAPDTFSVAGCPREARLHTLREPQKDGTERWFHLNCIQLERPAPEPWHCIEYPHRGFRADSYPGELGVWVDKPPGMPLDIARRAVAMAFDLLSDEGVAPECGNMPGDAKSFAALRSGFTKGDGLLFLSGEANGFSLSDGLDAATFEWTGAANSGARLQCWYAEEIVVTG
jgi:hypothetical protein